MEPTALKPTAPRRGSGSGSGCGRRRHSCRRTRCAIAHEPDDVIQRRVVPQLQRIITLNPIRLPDRREHLRLLDRIDPQIRLKIKLHIEQIRRIPRLLGHDLQHTLLDAVQTRSLRRSRRHSHRLRLGRRSRSAERERARQAPPQLPPHPVRDRARTRRHDSTSGSPATSTHHHAQSHTSPGSTRTPPPA